MDNNVEVMIGSGLGPILSLEEGRRRLDLITEDVEAAGELDELAPDIFEDHDGLADDWCSLEKSADEQGIEMDLSYSSLRSRFRVVVTDLDSTSLCKKFDAVGSQRFGHDTANFETAYVYAELLADKLDQMRAHPAP